MSLSPLSVKDYQAFDLLAQDKVQFMWPKELKSSFWIHEDILAVCSVQWRLEMTVVIPNFFLALCVKYPSLLQSLMAFTATTFCRFAAM